jgi:hypothetical protein
VEATGLDLRAVQPVAQERPNGSLAVKIPRQHLYVKR